MLGRALYYTKQSADGQTQIVQYTYDEKNNLTGLTESVGNSTQDYVYQYDANERLISMTVGDTTVSYQYDDFRRLSQKITKQGETTVKTETYTYFKPTETTTSTQIAEYRVVAGNTTTVYSYTYDQNGNILSISDGTHTTSYVYDSANQLVRENNQEAGYTHTWEYDNAGNILCRKEYDYTTADSLEDITPTDIVNYTYGDTGPALEPGEGELPIIPWSDETATNTDAWGDLLTAYDGNTITYDGIGNPLTWGNRTFTWQHGRQLATLTENGTTWSYTYGSDGMRTGRTNGTTAYSYVYNGSQLVQMTVGSDTLRFTYDAAGTPLTVTYNGTTYYYTTNMQGDVTSIVTETGVTVVTYSYDSWGELLSVTGTLANTLGTHNPLRYRGYVYDNETALYYLQSRYYDPVIGRWVNIDRVVSGVGDFVQGYNMFAYCFNNPVNMIDNTGSWPSWNDIIEEFQKAVEWVDSNIIQPAVEFVEAIAEDIGNYDANNQSEEKVLESNYFSSYKGVPVVRTNGDRSGSFGAIFLTRETNDRSNPEDVLRHEYGHTKQLEQLGVVKYALCIALPSWQMWGTGEYYSKPWEITADIYGDVQSRDHSQSKINQGFIYLEASKMAGPLIWLFIE